MVGLECHKMFQIVYCKQKIYVCRICLKYIRISI